MKTFLKNKLITHKSGFTLVETLVAVSIFSISLMVMMGVLADGIADTNYAQQKMTATYLAQEGIEYIRNMRDTFMLYHENGWEGFKEKLIDNECDSSNGCYFTDEAFNQEDLDESMTTLDLTACGGDCPNIRQLASTGKYAYSGTITDFIRTIQVTISGDNQEVEVFSTVSWEHGSGTYQVIFSENLFNWIE